jgi:uncharacterized protein (DUF433 family)
MHEQEERVDEPVIDWTQCRIVEVVPGRLSGTPVLWNTRLPVSAILNIYDGGLEPEEIVEAFELSVTDVRTILEFGEQRTGRRA